MAGRLDEKSPAVHERGLESWLGTAEGLHRPRVGHYVQIEAAGHVWEAESGEARSPP